MSWQRYREIIDENILFPAIIYENEEVPARIILAPSTIPSNGEYSPCYSIWTIRINAFGKKENGYTIGLEAYTHAEKIAQNVMEQINSQTSKLEEIKNAMD